MVTIATIHLTLVGKRLPLPKAAPRRSPTRWFPWQENGHRVPHNSEVQKVLIENGKAKGVKLLDGTEVTAKQLVVSDNASPQLFLRLIGEDKITDVMKRKAGLPVRSRRAVLGNRRGS